MKDNKVWENSRQALMDEKLISTLYASGQDIEYFDCQEEEDAETWELL